MLQPAVVVDLNAVSIQDEDVRHFSVAAAAASSDSDVRSSECIVQLPQSRVIMATAEPKPVKSSQVTAERNTAALNAVKSNRILKQNKRQSSSDHSHEPRPKRLRHEQQSKGETTAAVWTESLFIPEASQVGGDAAEVVSAVNTEQLKSVPLSSVSCAPLVIDAGQSETTSLRKFPQQNSADFTELPLKVTAGGKLVERDGVASSVSVEEGHQSSNVSSRSVDARVNISRSSRSVDGRLMKSPPAVHHTVVTGFPGSPRSKSVTMVGTAVLTSSSSCSAPSSATNTRFLVPILTNSVNVSTTSVYRVSPASGSCKTLTATAQQQSVAMKPASSSTAARQPPPNGASSSVVSKVPPSQSPSSSQSKPSVESTSLPTPTLTIRVHSSVTVSGPTQSSAFVQQQRASLPTAGNSSPQCTARTNLMRAVSSQPITAGNCRPLSAARTNLTRPSAVLSQPIRIRINAAELGDPSNPSAVMNHVRSILSRTNAILPGAEIRIRYLPPVTTATSSVPPAQLCPAQTTVTTATSSMPPAQSCPAQTTVASEPPADPRVSQLDGTADSDSESESETVKQNGESTSPLYSTGGVGTGNVGAVRSRRRSKAAADADEKPASDSRVR